MNQTNQSIHGQSFNRQIYIDGDLRTDPRITVSREPFLLERHHFEKLKNSEGIVYMLYQCLFGASVGLLINMLSKLIGSKMDKSIIFDKWEVYAFSISGFLTLICFVIYKLVPSEKSELMKFISNHFDQTHG